MRLADVEHSGRKDLIHLDKYTGAAQVFKNMGPIPAGGSAFTWLNRGVLYAAIDRGETMVSFPGTDVKGYRYSSTCL